MRKLATDSIPQTAGPGPAEGSLERLLVSARQADAAAQSALFRELSARLRPVIAYRLRTYRQEDRDDLLQDTLATFFEKIEAVQDHPERFALQILRNKIGNILQSPWQGKVDSIVSDDAEPVAGQGITEARISMREEVPDIHDTIDHARRVAQITAAIRKLGTFCRLILTGLLEGLAVAELWEQIQQVEPTLARGAFDKRIFDCKKKLREELRGVTE